MTNKNKISLRKIWLNKKYPILLSIFVFLLLGVLVTYAQSTIILVSPQNGRTDVVLPVTLVWQPLAPPISGTDGYAYYIYTCSESPPTGSEPTCTPSFLTIQDEDSICDSSFCRYPFTAAQSNTSYRWQIEADNGSSVGQSNIWWFTSEAGDQPDLVAATPTISGSLCTGDTLTLSAEIMNDGTGPVSNQNVTTRFQFAGSTRCEDENTNITISPLGTSTFSCSFVEDFAGSRSYYAQADTSDISSQNNRIAESNESNNQSGNLNVTIIDCPAPEPDYTIDEVVANWNGTICIGDNVPIDATVLNSGTGVANVSSATGLFADSTTICEVTTPALGVSGADSFTCTWTPDLAGTFDINSSADVGDVISESNEGNNSLSAGNFTVIDCSPAPVTGSGLTGDLNCDDVVDVQDLGIMLSTTWWGDYNGGYTHPNCP